MKAYRLVNETYHDGLGKTVHVHVSNATESITVSKSLDSGELVTREFKFEDMKAKRSFSDHQCFALSADSDFALSLFDNTLPTRQGAFEMMAKHNFVVVAMLVVPFQDSTFEECTIFVNAPVANGDTVVSGDVSIVEGHGFSHGDQVRNVTLPKLSLSAASSANAGDVIPIEVQLLSPSGQAEHHSAEVYLEAIGGILLTPRVKTNPSTGKATALISTAGMPQNYDIRVKAGFKYYTGVTECLVHLT